MKNKIFYHGTFSKEDFSSFNLDKTGAVYFTNSAEDAYMYSTKYANLSMVGGIVPYARIYPVTLDFSNSLYLDDEYTLYDLFLKDNDIHYQVMKEVKDVVLDRLDYQNEDGEELSMLLELYPHIGKRDLLLKTFMTFNAFFTHSKTFNSLVKKNNFDSIINRYDDLDKSKEHIILLDTSLINSFYL